MNLSTWIRQLLPLAPEKHWRERLATAPFPFPESGPDTLTGLLEALAAVPGFPEHAESALATLLTSGSPDSGLRQLHDFLAAYHEKHGQFFDFSQPHTAALLTIFGRSEFLARRLIRTPEEADDLRNSAFVTQKKTLEVMAEELESRMPPDISPSLPDLKNLLRRYKYEEFLRITVRDLAETGPFEETLEELSSLAVVLIRLALREVTRIALGTQWQGQWPFLVLGMGKLGGHELNYSSDVDLIFVHDYEPLSGDDEHDYTLRPKIARQFIDALCDTTTEGFLFRVDMRLRPGGDHSPLVVSLDEMEVYYSARGELWERQALIKAQALAGSPEVAEQFRRMIQPFVYSRLLDERLLKEMQRVKGRIEEEHLRESHLNVKLGVGGIREIEFFVQAFQLLYGGHRPTLQTPGTLSALAQLQTQQLVPETDLDTLQHAYVLLRRLEHRLQLREEHQTHTIPAEIPAQQRLARSFGLLDLDPEQARQRLLAEVLDTMAKVRTIFGGLFSDEHIELEASLRNSTRIQQFTPEEQTLLETVARQLAPRLRERPERPLSLRFQQLFERIGPRFQHYRMLTEHPSSLSRLARIAETSELLWLHLINHLELLELLESPVLDISRKNWEQRLQESLNGCEDEESEIDQLRKFKHELTFLIGSAELEGLIGYEQARSGLTLLAEVILQAALGLAQQYLAPRYGRLLAEENAEPGFAIVGMGKLGGDELTYHSDLDLIFLHSGVGLSSGPNEIEAQEYWIRVTQRLISILTTVTRTGHAYKLDTRLRPSGNAGVLVTSFESYLHYHQSSQPWEHQALIKGRIVAGAGSEAWFDSVSQGILRATYEWVPPADLAEQILHLRGRKERELAKETERRRNLKEGRGGLLDVEFLTQYLQLLHGPKHPELRTPQTLTALDTLARLQLLPAEMSTELKRDYTLLRLIENGLRLLYDESTNMLDLDQLPDDIITPLLRRHGFDVNSLASAALHATSRIRRHFQSVFNPQ